MIPASSALSCSAPSKGAAPLPQPEILHATRVLPGDSLEIADHQDPDPLLDGEVDHLLGGLVMRVVDAAAMASLHATQVVDGAASGASPAARLGRPPSCLAAAGLLILKVEVVLGADGAPPASSPASRVTTAGWDDAKIDPATRPRSLSWPCWTGSGGDHSHSRPPSASSVTARICSGG